MLQLLGLPIQFSWVEVVKILQYQRVVILNPPLPSDHNHRGQKSNTDEPPMRRAFCSWGVSEAITSTLPPSSPWSALAFLPGGNISVLMLGYFFTDASLPLKCDPMRLDWGVGGDGGNKPFPDLQPSDLEALFFPGPIFFACFSLSENELC